MVIEGCCKKELVELIKDGIMVDSIVTDPPYQIGFLNNNWDKNEITYDLDVWRLCLQILKPGGHLLAFGASRTYHRLACAIEDTGFQVRDQIMWLYGQGVPKSLGTTLKPAHEPIVLARKPLSEKTISKNILKHGTGRLNIDECRVAKRFPANVIHDGSDEIEKEFAKYGNRKSGTHKPYFRKSTNSYSGGWPAKSTYCNESSEGLASRFFYCAKISPKERGDCKHPTMKPLALMQYLVRLVTPINGIVLDPFAGSGTTLLSARNEGFQFIGIEKEPEYIQEIKRRLEDQEQPTPQDAS